MTALQQVSYCIKVTILLYFTLMLAVLCQLSYCIKVTFLLSFTLCWLYYVSCPTVLRLQSYFILLYVDCIISVVLLYEGYKVVTTGYYSSV